MITYTYMNQTTCFLYVYSPTTFLSRLNSSAFFSTSLFQIFFSLGMAPDRCTIVNRAWSGKIQQSILPFTKCTNDFIYLIITKKYLNLYSHLTYNQKKSNFYVRDVKVAAQQPLAGCTAILNSVLCLTPSWLPGRRKNT